jgi:hypothetical protein
MSIRRDAVYLFVLGCALACGDPPPPPNEAPTAVDDTQNSTEDTPQVITAASLLSNDTDPNSDTLSIVSVQNAQGGTVVLNGDEITFTPNLNLNGAASFEYTLSDGQAQDTGAVSMTIAAVNDAPVAADDSFSTNQDVSLFISTAQMLANDLDVEADLLSIVSVQNFVNCFATLSAAGVVVDPDPGFIGQVSFEYTLSDGSLTDVGLIQLDVLDSANIPPQAIDDTLVTALNASITVSSAQLVANDLDADNDPLSLLSVSNALNGTVSLSNNQVTFTPTQNFTGAASFEYTLSDGQGGTDTALVSVLIQLSTACGNSVLNPGDACFPPDQKLDVGVGARSLLVSELNGDGHLDLATGNDGDISVILSQGNIFQPEVRLSGGGDPFVVADLNNDGSPDFLGVQEPSLVAFLSGSLGSPISSLSSGRPSSLAVADFNGDGFQDVVHGNFFSSSVNVLLGNGDGTFGAPQLFQTSGFFDTLNVATGDLNADGFVDIVVNSSGIELLAGNGDGTFDAPTNVFFSSGVVDFALADLDNDALLDLAIGRDNSPGGLLDIQLNNGDGTFQFFPSITTDRLGSIAVGDANGDAVPDLLAGANVEVLLFLGNGDGTYQAPASFVTGSFPRDAALADVTQDGFADIVALNSGSHTISIIPGNGNGTFNAVSNIKTGRPLLSLKVADFNNDTIPDLATANDFASSVGVFLGAGGANFNAPNFFTAGSRATQIEVGELSGDTALDIVVVNTNDSDAGLLRGNGDGTFQAQQVIAFNSVEAVTLADFNADQKLDIAVSEGFITDAIEILLGNGDGTFQSFGLFSAGNPINSQPRGMATADLNGDTKIDLICANGTGQSVGIFLGNGFGGLQDVVLLPSLISPEKVITADLNQDGKIDIIANDFGSESIEVFLGNGDGTFQGASEVFVSLLGSSEVKVADMDGDGELDLVSVNPSDDATIALGNGDGTFQAPFFFAANGHPSSLAILDFNSDGALDLLFAHEDSQDLLIQFAAP